jgi:hypothetical protein
MADKQQHPDDAPPPPTHTQLPPRPPRAPVVAGRRQGRSNYSGPEIEQI